MNEVELDNVLVHQKNEIMLLIHSQDLDRMQRALDRLDMLAELWCNSTYHYKGKECCQLIRDYCLQLRQDTRNWKRRDRINAIWQEAGVMWDRFFKAEQAWKAA